MVPVVLLLVNIWCLVVKDERKTGMLHNRGHLTKKCAYCSVIQNRCVDYSVMTNRCVNCSVMATRCVDYTVIVRTKTRVAHGVMTNRCVECSVIKNRCDESSAVAPNNIGLRVFCYTCDKHAVLRAKTG